MEQNIFFNETCDPVDLTHCSQYHVDPCDCTKFYQCAPNQLRMFHIPCGPGTIYDHKTGVCNYPNDAICQTLRPWERCNVTVIRMKQLLLMCIKSAINSNNTWNSDQNTNGISVQTITHTILPAVSGVLVLAMLIGLIIYRYKRLSSDEVMISLRPDRISTTADGSVEATESLYDSLVQLRMTTERISTISDGSLGATERISTISDGSVGATEWFTRNHVGHLSDPYNSLEAVTSPIPEYGPYPTQRFNPMFCVDPNQPRDVPSANASERGTVSSGDDSYVFVEKSDSTPSPSTMPGASDDRECIARGFHSDNKPEGEIVSNEKRFNSITGESDTTHHRLVMPRPSEANRPDPNSNSQDDESASSGGSSYEFVTPEMSHSSDDNRKFANITVSSIRSTYVVVQQPDPLFPPYIRCNGPWPYKVIFSTKDHFLPPHTDRT